MAQLVLGLLHGAYTVLRLLQSAVSVETASWRSVETAPWRS